MKTHTTSAPVGEVEALITALFERFPALVGFSIQETEPQTAVTSEDSLETDLCLSDVETFPRSAKHVELLSEIAAPLQELLEAAPAARELLSGRTFARALH